MTPDRPADPDHDRLRLEGQFRRVFDVDPELADVSPAARRLLATAAVLFFRNGYTATSVRELGRACGLSPAAFYNHFSSRDELLFVLSGTGHAAIERALSAALADSDGSPADRFRRYVRAYVERHLLNPALAQLIHREYVHLTPGRCSQIVERRRRIREWLVDILRDGAGSGAFTLIQAPNAAVRQAMMVLDMCSRTSEWFNPTRASAELADSYVVAALRLVGAQT